MKTLARLADLEPAILAANPVPADPLGDLQRAIKAINHGLVSGLDAPTLTNLYCDCMVALIQLASQRQTTLDGCRKTLRAPIEGFTRFYNSQGATWEKLPLWLSCLAGALKYDSKMSVYHLAVIAECINEGSRIALARTADQLMEQRWSD